MLEILKQFYPHLVYFSLIYIAVFVAVLLDLWSGIRKAKKRKEFRTSQGLRRTIDKLCRYFNMLFAVSLIDCLQMLAITQYNLNTNSDMFVTPLFSFIGGIFAVYIELRSIYESNEIKAKKQINIAKDELVELIKEIKELKKNH